MKITHDKKGGTREKAETRRARQATLATLQENARQRLAERNGGPSKPRFRRPSRWRLLVWGIELAVVLAVFDQCVMRSARRRSPAPPPPSRSEPLPVEVPALGEEGRSLKGLTECTPATLAATDGLAPGSTTAQQTQLSYSRDARLPIEVSNSIGMRLRLIPPGTAIIGSPETEAGRGPSEIQHVSVIPLPFYLGTCEVTQEQWDVLMPENPSHFKGAKRPVEELTWYDCQRFINALCAREDVPEGTYRLPTETEWEYACRAGTQTAYYFGDDPSRLGEFADFGGNNYRSTVPVGGRRPNGWGLYNMHGNVWEWCLNRFAPYPDDPRPPNPETEAWRCIRGGNWHMPAADCRSAERSRLAAPSHGNVLGFRILRTIPEIHTGEPPSRD